MSSSTPDTPFDAVTIDAWRAQAEHDLGGRSLDRLRWRTDDGIEVEPLYGSEAAAQTVALPARSDAAPWLVEQSVNSPYIDESASEAAASIARGADRIVLRLDASARAGRDADAEAQGDADGVPLSTALDAARWLTVAGDVNTAIRLDAGDGAFAAAALFFAARRRDRHDDADAHIVAGADPFAHLFGDGAVSGTVEDAIHRAVCLAAWCVEHAPACTPLLASGRPLHDAGAPPALEIGWTVAVALTYLRALDAAGVPLDSAAGLIALERCVTPAQFEEIAATRALRTVWTRVLEASGVSVPTTVFARTSMRTHTAVDPWVNALRATTEVFAAATGGADAILVAPFDARLGQAQPAAARLARNTQLVLRDEAGVAVVTDPAAGSWFVESLTSALCREGWRWFCEIERAGGPLAFAASGALHDAVDAVVAERAGAIALRRRPITGVTEFPPAPDEVPEKRAGRPRADLVQEAARALSGHRARFAATAALEGVKAARGAARFAAAIDAAAAGATLQAITRVTCTGPDAAVRPLTPAPDAAPFEALRARVDARTSEGARPTALLVCVGALAEHNARATWITNFLAIAGIDARWTEPIDEPAEAAHAWSESGADLAVLCGTDERYASDGAAFVKAVTGAGARSVHVAGRSATTEVLLAAGAAGALYAGCNALNVLSDLVETLGVNS